jgi:transglutaminase-like putative cysteine protease
VNLIVESNHREDYLRETDEIDYSHASIREKAHELSAGVRDETGYIQAVFEFVRDQIAHSWDIQSSRVTYIASDVLRYKEGICYAKSILLCALLRSQGIPTAFCYQRLTLGDTPDTGYVIHALNGVYVRAVHKWVRLDARGNKPGVDAQFSLDQEQLAFPVRTHYEESDYPTLYASPDPATIALLKRSANCLDMYRNRLPSSLSD